MYKEPILIFLSLSLSLFREDVKKVTTINVTDLRRSVGVNPRRRWLYTQLKKPQDIKRELEEWQTAWTALHLLLIRRPAGVRGRPVPHLGPIPTPWV